MQIIIGTLALVLAFFAGAYGANAQTYQYDDETNTGITGTLGDFFFGSEGYQEITTWHGGTPVVRTLGVANVTQTTASLQAYFDSYDTDYNMQDAPRLGVQYRGPDVQQNTQFLPQGTGSRSITFKISGLQADENYEYRAVLYYGNQTAYGEWNSFTTLRSGQKPVQSQVDTSAPQGQTNPLSQLEYLLFGTPSAEGSTTPSTQSTSQNTSGTGTTPQNTGVQSTGTVTRTNTTTTNTASTTTTGTADRGTTIGSSNGLLVGITNDVTRVESGDRIVFQVAAANRSSQTASSARITIEIPDGYEFVSTDMGTYDKEDREITIKLGSLLPGDREETSFVLRASARDDDTVTTSATLTANQSGSSRSLTATDTDQLIGSGDSGNILGASIFGTGFFPQSLLGWIAIIVIIAAIVFIARRYAKNKQE